jgi:YD repeat-containing protein
MGEIFCIKLCPYRYDGSGNLISETNSEGITLKHAFDKHGNEMEESIKMYWLVGQFVRNQVHC